SHPSRLRNILHHCHSSDCFSFSSFYEQWRIVYLKDVEIENLFLFDVLESDENTREKLGSFIHRIHCCVSFHLKIKRDTKSIDK
ncbi:hypothetical protein PFISCL1PPCAC_5971, partial [Pristionchus fissidentatus]